MLHSSANGTQADHLLACALRGRRKNVEWLCAGLLAQLALAGLACVLV